MNNLVELQYACLTKSLLMIVTKFCKYGSLHYHIKRLEGLDPKVVKNIAQKLLIQVEEYHSLNKVKNGF